MARLWGVFDGEPFLDNPHLQLLVNPLGRTTKMRRTRDSKGRFVKKGRKRQTRAYVKYAKRRKAVRRVQVARAPVLAVRNPRRKKRVRRNDPGKRRYAYVMNRKKARHNPAFGGLGSIFSTPTLKNVGFGLVGLAGTPMLVAFVRPYLPAAIATNRWAGYLIKGVSAWGLSWGAGKVMGKEAGKAVLIGGLTYTAFTLVADFFPTLLGVGTTSATTQRYLQKQPLLAEYALRGPITQNTPGRLDPGARF